MNYKLFAKQLKQNKTFGKNTFESVRYSSTKERIWARANSEIYSKDDGGLFIFEKLNNKYILFNPQLVVIKEWQHVPKFSEIINGIKKYSSLDF